MSCILLVLVTLAQDTDRSSPERVYEEFSRLRRSAELAQFDAWVKVRIEADVSGESQMTAEFRDRAIRAMRNWKAFIDTSTILSAKPSCARRTDNGDGSVTIEGRVSVRARELSPVTGKFETVERVELERAVLRRMDKIWIVHELCAACEMCKGTAACGLCEGKEANCPACKGRGKCEGCKAGFTTSGLAPSTTVTVIADAEPRWSTDLSSPKAAARAYAELILRRELAVSESMMKHEETMLSRFKPFLAPDAFASLELGRGEAVEKGKARWKDGGPSVLTVEESAGHASAIILLRGQSTESERKRKITFRKLGERWLVAGEEHPCMCEGKCWGCDGKGDGCRACAGTGRCARCGTSGWYDAAKGK